MNNEKQRQMSQKTSKTNTYTAHNYKVDDE